MNSLLKAQQVDSKNRYPEVKTEGYFGLILNWL